MPKNTDLRFWLSVDCILFTPFLAYTIRRSSSKTHILTSLLYRLSLMDSTHKTNYLGWYLFTIMVRNDTGSFRPCAHFLTSNKDSLTIAKCLHRIKRWCRKAWNPRYYITDDSPAEQLAVKLAFRGLKEGEQEVTHLHCRVHLERTLERRIKNKDI